MLLTVPGRHQNYIFNLGCFEIEQRDAHISRVCLRSIRRPCCCKVLWQKLWRCEEPQGDEARCSTTARSVSQQDTSGSVQVQPAHELVTISSPQPQPALIKEDSAQGLSNVQARAQEAGEAGVTAEQIVSQADKLHVPERSRALRVHDPAQRTFLRRARVCELPVTARTKEYIMSNG